MAHRKCKSPWCGECNFTWDKPEVAAKMAAEDAGKIDCLECHTTHLPGQHLETISDEFYAYLQSVNHV